MIKNYLKILEDSLVKKSEVLEQIIAYNKEQEELLKKEDVSLEELDANMAKKDEFIQNLLKLDDGFESLYEKIREQLLENKTLYAEQIHRLQELISKVTDKGVAIKAQEARNKQLIENYFAREKKQLRQGRQASKAAYDYYKSMNNVNVVPPQIMDQKK
jgi:hypothetical protein